ncbi:MAG TPA: hypothetical protein GX515_07250 [Firmicutes bacterium]|nr:hypothetical protein [Bacillota bacterium]
MNQLTSDIVWVRRQWNHWQKAAYRLKDLTGIHWDVVSGGCQAPAPRPFIHAYVQCDAMIEGELAHSGVHGPCPHTIKVCIVKKDNDPKVFARLVQVADGFYKSQTVREK